MRTRILDVLAQPTAKQRNCIEQVSTNSQGNIRVIKCWNCVTRNHSTRVKVLSVFVEHTKQIRLKNSERVSTKSLLYQSQNYELLVAACVNLWLLRCDQRGLISYRVYTQHAMGWTVQGSKAGVSKKFSLLRNVQTASGARPVLYKIRTVPFCLQPSNLSVP
jgi:1-aminocyclopropane-1-carboxylate deaminase/D-cysteine desulfhydrase-like pyridoxal-dependent ACC family enzyme